MGSCSGQRFEDRDAIVGADGVSVCLCVKDAERQDLVDVVCVEQTRSAMRTGFRKTQVALVGLEERD